jgi:hypothetical protein
MVQRTPPPTPALYETDETGWLEATAELVRTGRLTEVDTASLVEYLTDTTRRDRKEVVSRLVVLLTLLLKYEYQPEHRSGSWRITIRNQRRELADDVSGGTLRKHALESLAAAYEGARQDAADETGLPLATFPEACPWTLDEAVSGPDPA